MCGGEDRIFFDLQVVLEFSRFLSNILRINFMNFDAIFVEEASISCNIFGEIFPRFIQSCLNRLNFH